MRGGVDAREVRIDIDDTSREAEGHRQKLVEQLAGDEGGLAPVERARQAGATGHAGECRRRAAHRSSSRADGRAAVRPVGTR
jgi:hypothetical protein